MKHKVAIFFIIFVAVSLIGGRQSNAGWFGPSSFTECIIENMRGQLDGMTAFVHHYCTKKFPACKKADEKYKECMKNKPIGDSISCAPNASDECNND